MPDAKKSNGQDTLRSQFPFLWKICLLHGIFYLLFAYHNPDGIGRGIFSGISACFFLLVAKRLQNHPAEGEKLSIVISRETVFYFVAAVLISFGSCLTDNSFFLFFNFVGSFLLFSIACIKLFFNDRKWDFGKYISILFVYWMQVLEMAPVPFRDFAYCRKHAEKKMSPTKRYVFIGIAAGLPILLVTTLLLASADQIFSDMLGKIFDFEGAIDWILEKLPGHMLLLPLSFVVYTLLIYAVFAALCKGGFKEEMAEPARFGTAIAVTIFSMIDVVYVLFSGIQFLFLFGGLPAGYVYAEYARQGFFELLLVALINFILVLFCNKHFVKNTALKIAMSITCACTFVMIVSSAYRMYMYISVYHLTFLRVLVLWFLLMLSFFMIGSTISIYKENWNSFRYCLGVLTCFYLVFSLSGIDGWIAKYNVIQFERDLQECLDQGKKVTVPHLDQYLPDNYRYSMAYAVELSGLREKYGDSMGRQNLFLIRDYLLVPVHFYEYDYDAIDENDDGYDDYETDWPYDYIYQRSAAIYDKGRSNSILMWRHFNFVENACYKRCKPSKFQ